VCSKGTLLLSSSLLHHSSLLLPASHHWLVVGRTAVIEGNVDTR